MVIAFSGLASGLDTESMVSQLVALQRIPITQLQQQQKDLTAKSNKWTTLKLRLTDLRTATQNLDSKSEAEPNKVSSTDSSVFTVSSTGGGTLGRFDVRVTQLAKAPRIYSNAVATRDSAGGFGAGTLSLQIGTGTAIDVAVDAADSLDSVVNKINASGAGVTAGVLYDGTAYRLQISGNQTGTANALTVTETGVSFGLNLPVNIRQAAQDATLEVDGFAVTSSTNSVSGTIPGVTLNLVGTSSGTSTQAVEITRDDAALQTRLQSFVSAYNNITSFINAESAYVGVKKGPESLSGDAGLRSVQSRLRTTITTAVTGATGRYNTLASIGLSLQTDGSLTLSSTKLATALAADPAGVTNMLAGGGSVTTSAMKSVDTLLGDLTDATNGIPSQRIASISRRNREIGTQVTRMNDRVSSYEKLLRSQFASLEKTMSGLQSQGSRLQAALGQLQ
jgi:flagellar hook-associated protein 2